jgi:hypothetical protein
MSSPPKLYLVDSSTGEAVERCEHCETKDDAIERLTRSFKGTINKLEQEKRALEDELREQTLEVDAGAYAVIEDWCTKAHAHGWWTRRPIPTEPRLKAAERALKKHNVAYLCMVHTGAFLAANRRNPRAWMEPMTLYGHYIDTHYQNAIDPENRKVRLLTQTPPRLFHRWFEVVELADVCECGHWRLDHGKTGDGEWPCAVHGCTCDCFVIELGDVA